MSEGSLNIGLRLQEGREARLLTQAEIADRAGLSRATISAYEKGLRIPSIESLNKIATILDIPISYFRSARPIRESRITPLSFRRKSRASLGHLRRVERYEEWLSDIYTVFSQYLSFPTVNLPLLEIEFETLEDYGIEEIAIEVRKQWGMGIGPIVNLTAFLEANGFIIGRADFEQDIDGASNWRGHHPYIILNSRVTSSVRQRFSLAHELGHLVLHKLADETDFENKERHKLLETQATLFAQSFLFPAQAYSREVPNLKFDYLIELKKRWGVSLQTIALRGRTLGIVNDDQVSYFYRQLNAQGFSRSREPLDTAMACEVPTLFQKSMRLLSEQESMSLFQLIDDLILSTKDFSMLTGINYTDFEQSQRANIIYLNRKNL